MRFTSSTAIYMAGSVNGPAQSAQTSNARGEEVFVIRGARRFTKCSTVIQAFMFTPFSQHLKKYQIKRQVLSCLEVCANSSKNHNILIGF